MAVALQLARTPDLNIRFAVASPYASAPSSPPPFDETFNYQYHYTSAPTSPNRASAIYSQFNAWAYPTPSPRLGDDDDDDEGDLFDFTFPPRRQHGEDGFQLPEITTADKLFDKGRIRPLQEWGRTSSAKSSRSGRRETRSLSPRRDERLPSKNITSPCNPVKCGASRKWPRLKDLLLFRSASEGRATGRESKDPLRKYTLLSHVSFANKKKWGESKKNDGEDAVRRTCGSKVSPHEKLYTQNRAAAEEQRKKTPLPFQRQGLLGFIHFNPAIRGKSKTVGSSSFSRGKL